MAKPDAAEVARIVSEICAHRLYEEVIAPRPAKHLIDGRYLAGRAEATQEIVTQLMERVVNPLLPKPPAPRKLRLVKK